MLQSAIALEEVVALAPVPEHDKYAEVVTSQLTPKLASSALLHLSNAVPLEKFNLEHLKRIRRTSEDANPNEAFYLEILLCPVKDLHLLDADVLERYPVKRIVQVCKYTPRNRAEFDEYKEISYFPILFRPNDLDREREKGISEAFIAVSGAMIAAVEEDSESVARIARASLESLSESSSGAAILAPDIAIKTSEIPFSRSLSEPLSRTSIGDSSCALTGGVLVDPATSAVLMTVAHALSHAIAMLGPAVVVHPLYSPTMLLVFGMSAVARGDLAALGAVPSDQYLLTGLSAYLRDEPDVASSMALVHSRILRVVYAHRTDADGGLGSRYSVHSLPSINHRFRVFRVLR